MDTMEKVFVFKDPRSFECSSPSELDRRFFGEQSLLSALSLEQLSKSKVSDETTAEKSDSRASVPPSLCLSMDTISPCVGFAFHSSNIQETNCNLTVPLQEKFSTPNIPLQKPKNASCFERSYSDAPDLQISWDVSLIKSESNSPRFFVDSSAQEQTWSPNPQQQSLAEFCPCSGETQHAH